jgi:hypothetical protein
VSSPLPIPLEPAPGEPGSPENPIPAPSLGWTMGLTDDPTDFSHDQDPEVLAALEELNKP